MTASGVADQGCGCSGFSRRGHPPGARSGQPVLLAGTAPRRGKHIFQFKHRHPDVQGAEAKIMIQRFLHQLRQAGAQGLG